MRDFVEGDTKVLSARGDPLPNSVPRSLPSIRLASPLHSDTWADDHHHHKSVTSVASQYNYKYPSPTTGSFQAQWLFFHNLQWVPLDLKNHARLERTLQLGGVFVDIEDSHFPSVHRIRVFPGADYLSYLGVRFRISRVLLPPL